MFVFCLNLFNPPPGVSIPQENLNYSPALSVVCQIFPQILPQLQSYRCLLTRSMWIDLSFDIFSDDFMGASHWGGGGTDIWK